MKIWGILITIIVALGLYLDARFPAWGQPLVNVAIWAAFFVLFAHVNREDRVSLILCLIFATLGEMFLSLVWQLYEYRQGGIPLFVFPGHCLLYWLGILLAKRTPFFVVYLVPALTFPYIIYSAVSGIDTECVLWFSVYVAFLVFFREKRLYAVMFVLALALEIYGTRLGNWTWNERVPLLGLTSANPPACAGVFYCFLDLFVICLTPLMAEKTAQIQLRGIFTRDTAQRYRR